MKALPVICCPNGVFSGTEDPGSNPARDKILKKILA
jgi:hypothetical protein